MLSENRTQKRWTITSAVFNSIGRHRCVEWARSRHLGTRLEGSSGAAWTHELSLSIGHGRGVAQPWRSIWRIVVDARGRLILSWSLVGDEGIHRSICSRQHHSSESRTRLPTVVVVVIVAELSQLLKVDLVAKDTANTAEALDELVALSGAVRDEFQRSTELAIVLGNPL